jgi:hypothetical protein
MTRKFSIQLFIPDPGDFREIPPFLLNEVDSLWIDLKEAESSADCNTIIERIRSSSGKEVVPLIGSSSGDRLLSCIRDRVAVRLEDKKPFFSAIPQEKRENLSICIVDDDFRGIDGGDDTVISQRLDLIASSVRDLRGRGFHDLTVNLYHPDPVIHYKTNLFLHQELGVRTIVSLVPDRAGSLGEGSLREGSLEEGSIVEGTLIKGSLSLSPTLYEGMSEGLLICPTQRQIADHDALEAVILSGKRILAALKIIPRTHMMISCPVCGRCLLDLSSAARMIKDEMDRLVVELGPDKKLLEDAGGITVAVMGCNVNGPGEARDADIGIAGGKNKTGIIFRFGKPTGTVEERDIVEEMVKGIREVIDEKIRR